MQFEDTTKKYEIEFRFIRNKKINPVPAFEIKMIKPITASAMFSVDDIESQQGHIGIKVNKYSDIAKKIKSKKDVLIVVAPEAIEYIKENNIKELMKLKDAAKKDPVRWFWAITGDTHEFYITPDNETGTIFRKEFEKLQKILQNKINWRNNPLDAVSNPVERDTSRYTMNGWYEIKHTDLMKIYTKITEMDEAKKVEKQKKEAEIFAKAKKTGEKQILESYSVECNDPEESCDVDIITVYAMPDGTTKRTQKHTW